MPNIELFKWEVVNGDPVGTYSVMTVDPSDPKHNPIVLIKNHFVSKEFLLLLVADHNAMVGHLQAIVGR